MKELAVVTPLHRRTKRDYLGRMQDDKVHCMQTAKKFDREFWDGERRYGYGGYTYDGRWAQVARALIDIYNLPAKAKILDVGCGKGFLLFEFSRLLPEAELHGFDISSYAVSHAKAEIRDRLFVQKAEEPYDFAVGYFDLVVSLGTLHNLKVSDLAAALGEVERVGREKYIMVESYRNDDELFNLQCWALTCESFFRPEEWQWLMGIFGYKGDYEFIYFE
ncbi:MAG: class I SAM-dependent methyltransferase [Proteobacteria bacterium]|nr:class I SAM-dependent methyltransferase [Pseudomonadota bacterium]MBU4296657.1 class I SAM-dependent methyltransferase [Pseudomonadota bacterium]MCG2748450.1 class I SAM-dependent methyltransferase [Desulfobulbaceae bacterium]